MEVDFYEIFLGIVFSGTILALLTLAFSFFFRAFAFPRSAIIYSFLTQVVFLTGFNFTIYHLYIKLITPIDLLFLTYDSQDKYLNYFQQAAGNRFKIQKFETKSKPFEEIEEKVNNFGFILIDNKIDTEIKEKILIKTITNEKKVYVVPGIYELLLLNTNTHFIGEVPILETGTLSPTWFEGFIKRTLDLVVAIIALVFFSPLILIVSLLIFFESGFPIFFLQERAGAKEKIFKTIKFRTMIKDAEKYTGPVLSNENDPRITRVGKFLRKTGIDEIPQFINV